MKEKYTFRFNKLVRDNIPEIMEDLGAELVIKNLVHQEYIIELKNKLLEESKEVLMANTKEELLEEVADVFEVLYCLAKASNISLGEIEQARINKVKAKGSFADARFIDKVLVKEDFKFIKYYRSKSEEYPEIA